MASDAPRCLRSHSLKCVTRSGAARCNGAASGWQTPNSTRCRRKSLAPKMVWWLRATSRRARTSAPAQMLAERREIDLARHRPLPSGDVAKVRRRPQISNRRVGAVPLPLERGCETVKVSSARPAPQMRPHLRLPRSSSPTYSSPFVIGHWRPSRRRRGTVLLWRGRSLQFTEKAATPERQLPITESAHKAGNGRRPLPVEIGIARNARPRPRGNGSKTARRSCCRFPTTTSSSPCRRRSAPSRSRTRPPSMTSCSGPPRRR